MAATSSRPAGRVHHHDRARDRCLTRPRRGPLVLLFDLDGTLTDSRSGIVRCMKHALDTLGAPCPPDDVLASFIGPPIRGAFATLLATSDRSLIERAIALYREEYGERGLFENEIYTGVAQMLDQACELASAAFVATAKLKIYADRIVRRLGLERYFAGVYGPDLSGRLDDKADLLAHLLASENVSPERAVMIGDRAGDVVSARANRVRSIGVLWGYGSESELKNAGRGRPMRDAGRAGDQPAPARRLNFRRSAGVDYPFGCLATSTLLEDRTLICWRPTSERRVRVVRSLVAAVVLVLLAVTVGPSAGQERLVSKQDADRIFGLTRTQWEAEAAANGRFADLEGLARIRRAGHRCHGHRPEDRSRTRRTSLVQEPAGAARDARASAATIRSGRFGGSAIGHGARWSRPPAPTSGRHTRSPSPSAARRRRPPDSTWSRSSSRAPGDDRARRPRPAAAARQGGVRTPVHREAARVAAGRYS